MKSDALLVSSTPRMINPNKERILKEAGLITESLGMLQEGSYKDYSSMASYLYPSGGISKVIDATVFFNILYFFDDIYGEDTHENRYVPNPDELILVWQGNEFHNDPQLEQYVKGIRKLQEIISRCKPGVASNISESLFSHLKNSTNPQEYFSVDEYISIRLQVSGMLLPIDFMEYVYGFEISPYERKFIREERLLCGEIGALLNDIFSFPKEGKGRFNIVNALLSLNLVNSVEQAIDLSIEIINNKVKRLMEIFSKQGQEIDSYGSSVKSYRKGLNAILAASYHWQCDTQRYRHTEHYFEDFRV